MSIRRRPVHVATVSHRPALGVSGRGDLDRFMTSTEVWVERASRMGADLVAFPEIYPQIAIAAPYDHAEPADGGTLVRVQELARKYKLLIVWPRVETEPRRGVRNTAILVGRDGEVIGRYDKMFPTVTELEKGVVPGTDVPVFETDIGRVGMLICFDLNFPEAHASLAKGKPDIVVFSSMYRGGLQAQSLAFELGSFVVTSIASELGLVIDRCGRVIKESTYEALAVAPINTNSVALHMDFNYTKMDAMLARYGKSVSFDYHTREAFYVVSSEGERDVNELVKEFDLETAESYWARSRRKRAEAIEKFRAGVKALSLFSGLPASAAAAL